AVPEPGRRPGPADLRAHVATLLPDYMVPAVVVVLDGPLPLTPNGKLDRRALPAPDWASLTGSAEPVTPLQRELAALVAEVLGLPEVGLHDNFFEIGGHSMAAMRLLARIRAGRDAGLTLRDVFDAPTVAALAERLDERADTGGTSGSEPRLTAAERPEEARLAPVQRWPWSLYRRGTGRAYTSAFALRPDGPGGALDRDAL